MLEKFKILGKTLKYHGHIVDFYCKNIQIPDHKKLYLIFILQKPVSTKHR